MKCLKSDPIDYEVRHDGFILSKATIQARELSVSVTEIFVIELNLMTMTEFGILASAPP